MKHPNTYGSIIIFMFRLYYMNQKLKPQLNPFYQTNKLLNLVKLSFLLWSTKCPETDDEHLLFKVILGAFMKNHREMFKV